MSDFAGENGAPKTESKVDFAVIGAGAAGLMAAIAAGNAGASVRLLDGAKKIGAKILVSGGSRCNVTNEHVVPARYHGEGAAPFVSRVLRSFSPDDTHRFFAQSGVELKLEPTGKFFPVTDSSRTVLNALLAQVERAGAVLSVQTPVLSLEKLDGFWRLETPTETIWARAVLVATGGLALPKSGSDGSGFRLAQGFGHSVVKTTPALTPLLCDAPFGAQFSGQTLPAKLRLFRRNATQLNEKLAAYDGSFLWTHTGYSGPVALNLSRHVARERWKWPHASVFASFLPHVDDGEENAWWQSFVRENAKRGTFNALSAFLPNALAQTLAQRANCDHLTVGRLEKRHIEALKNALFYLPLDVREVAPYEKAETTAGGIALEEIAPATMMSRLHKGLFFAGEVCDVDGWLGGYNFQWAWSSGTVAGRAAAKFLKEN